MLLRIDKKRCLGFCPIVYWYACSINAIMSSIQFNELKSKTTGHPWRLPVLHSPFGSVICVSGNLSLATRLSPFRGKSLTNPSRRAPFYPPWPPPPTRTLGLPSPFQNTAYDPSALIPILAFAASPHLSPPAPQRNASRYRTPPSGYADRSRAACCR